MDIFDAKVVNDKGKSDGVGDVAEQAWCAFGWLIAICGKVLDQSFIGEKAGLGKVIHYFSNFDVDISMCTSEEGRWVTNDVGGPEGICGEWCLRCGWCPWSVLVWLLIF
jgi:hypothetical protein